MVASESAVVSRPNHYALAGWLSIASAILIIPEISLAVFIGFLSPKLEVLLAPLRVVNVVISIFILYMFRKLLNERFDFHRADVLIHVLIAVNIVFFFLGMIDIFAGLLGAGKGFEIGFSIVAMVLFVVFCIIHIIYGIVLLRLEDDLFGLLKPYAMLIIVSGALGVTVILIPFALLAAIAHMIVLGMIFLRAKEDVEYL
jgi:hypothetical protein